MFKFYVFASYQTNCSLFFLFITFNSHDQNPGLVTALCHMFASYNTIGKEKTHKGNQEEDKASDKLWGIFQYQKLLTLMQQ